MGKILLFQDSQDGETVPVSQSMHVSESERGFTHPPIRTNRNLKRRREDEREQEAYNFLKVDADLETFLLPTDAHNVKKHRVIKTF